MDEPFRGHKGWSDITFRDAMEHSGTQMQIIVNPPAPLVAWSWRDWREREPVLIADAAVSKLDRDIRYNEGYRNRLRKKLGNDPRLWKTYIEGLKPLRFRWKKVFPCP